MGHARGCRWSGSVATGAADRRAGAALRRHRPAPGAAARSGGCRSAPTAWPRSAPRWSRRSATGWPYSSRNRHFSSVSVLPESPYWSRQSDSCARRARSCCSTSSGATSARPRRRTPTRTSIRRARCSSTRSPSARTWVSARWTRSWPGGRAHGGGVFVLALTSNPEGRAGAAGPRPSDGQTVAQTVIDRVGRGQRRRAAARVGWGGHRGDHRRDRPRPEPARRAGARARASARRGRPRLTCRPCCAGLRGVAVPSYSRAVLGRGPDVAALRDAAAQRSRTRAEMYGNFRFYEIAQHATLGACDATCVAKRRADH